MSLAALKKSFTEESIGKHEFIHKMHQQHKLLFDYFRELPNTDITRIEIDPTGVYFSVKHRALDYAGEGIRFSIDPQDERLAPVETFNFGTYEDGEFALIKELMEGKKLMLDVGGNIGFHALSLARQFPEAQIHCFEPIPFTYSQLCKNLLMNNLDNVTTYNFGFSNETTELTFYFYAEGSVNASAANLSDREDIQEITCQVTTVDSFVNEKDMQVDFIKCDVEGAELHVFQGALETLETQRPIVFSEILRKWSAKFNYNPNEIFELFRSKNYSAYTCADGKLSPFTTMTEETVETNFFFLPNE